jgi:hypothetical protein
MRKPWVRRSVGAYLVIVLVVFAAPARAVPPQAPPGAGEGPISARLAFSTVPAIGRPAELALAISTDTPSLVSVAIELPDAVTLVSGSLSVSSEVSPEAEWEHTVIVELTAAEYAIRATVRGETADGVPVVCEAVLYIAATTDVVAVGIVPVWIPGASPGRERAPQGGEADEPGAPLDPSPQLVEPEPGPVSDATPDLAPTPAPAEDPRETSPGESDVDGEVAGAAPASVDLIVEDIWSTTVPLHAGEWENITFRIRNQGTSATGTTFYIRLWVDGVSVGTWYTNGLGAGATATSSINVRLDPGSREVKVEVDTTHVVTESDETNNARTENWTWLGPDLIVEDIWSTTLPLDAGEWENITFRIKNQGAIATGTTFYIKLWVDGVSVGTWYTNGLGAGATATSSINVRLDPGSHEVKVEVDTTSAVGESDETNNARIENWTWRGPDLIVEDIWSTTAPLDTFQVEDISFRITNDGQVGTSETICAAVWVDGRGIAIWCPTGGLEVGEDMVGSMEVELNRPGIHEVEVRADYGDGVPEIDEANNVRVEHWHWSGHAAYLPMVTRGF